jgi:hypothetical protein
MYRNNLLMLSLVLSSLTLSPEVRAGGPTTMSYPYGKDWQGTRYGPHRPWWSAGVILGNKPARMTIDPSVSTPAQFLFGAEGRYHLSPRLALVAAAHFAGRKAQAKTKFGSTKYTLNFSYKETAWQAGVDFGLWETKMAHLQIGPRLGVQVMKAELTIDGLPAGLGETETKAAEEHAGTGWVNTSDPFVGAAARLGVFVRPFVEVGLHAQYEMIYGLQKPAAGYSPGRDSGIELGGYSVVHF